MRNRILLLLTFLLCSVSLFSQRYYSRGYYPTRACYHDCYPRRVIVEPYYNDVVYIREQPRVIHIENVQREKVIIHNRVEREYININEPIIDEVYDDGRREVILNNEEYIPTRDMWEIPIHFKINSSILNDDIDRNTCSGELSIFNVVMFLRKNPEVSITLYAYSDMRTGTERDNYYLAKKRGETVYHSLVYKYDISPNRIVVRVMGSETQYYSTNRWNRCVIIKAN